MPQRRKPSMQHIPAYEDAGLFKSTITPIHLELVPHLHRNARQDLVVRGFVGKQQAISVVFAGRRAKQVAPLEAQLHSIMAQARRAAQGDTGTAFTTDQLRMPLKAEGAWRPTFLRDDSGWETRDYHFMVARWTMIDGAGNIDVYGAAPVLSLARRLKKKGVT